MTTIPLSWQVRLRSLARRIGLKPLLNRLLNRQKDYEDRFSEGLLAEVKPGDVVWDVGANVGYYTSKLAAAVGQSGAVLAFEPFSAAFRELEKSAAESGSDNIRLFQKALGAAESTLEAPAESGSDSVTNSLAPELSEKASSGALETVEVVRGDFLVKEGALVPNVLKIDVEAYEEEVLQGLRDTLCKREVRSVFVEVHFGQLESRGFPSTPQRIQLFLQDCGYEVTWLDYSHIAAKRGGGT